LFFVPTNQQEARLQGGSDMARIAVFDTEYSTLRALYYALEGEGHEVITNTVSHSADGQAITQLVTDPISLLNTIFQPRLVNGKPVILVPDLFIIDFLNLDGEKIMNMLKQVHRTKDVPVIAISHKANGISREQLLKIYGTHYIPKPFNVWRVVECAEAFLGVVCQ